MPGLIGRKVVVSTPKGGHLTLTVLLVGVITASYQIASAPRASAAAQPEVSGMERRERLETLAQKLRVERASLVFPKKKKLIQVNGRVPSPAYVRENIGRMEEKPFDGTIIHLHERLIFNPAPFDEADFLQEYEDLAAIQWGKFTDNFIWTVCNADLDWFDEEQWQAVLHNTRIFAKAALFGRCAGIVFDPENYGFPVFSYPDAKHHDTRTFEEYEARLEHCGEEWIRAVQGELPKARVLDLWYTGAFISGDDRALWSGRMTPREARAGLRYQGYGLVPAFMNGMLRGAAPTTVIVDGNEGAYYYESKEEFLGFVRFSKQLLPQAYVEADLRDKYHAQVQTGSSYYNGYCYGHFRHTPAPNLTDEEKAKWLEHNVYWALTTSDEYVWEWLEQMNWWQNELEPGYEEAVRSARRKAEAGEPLGFDMNSIFEAMKQRARAKLPTARVAKAGSMTVPSVDGLLDDPVWQQALPLALGPMLDCNDPAQATEARLCYDDRALYIAFRCSEPSPDKMYVSVTEHDQPWIVYDDNVEVVISAASGEFPVYKFMMNPKSATWDAIYRNGGKPDSSYDPEWQNAASIGADSWTAEMAIPWKALRMVPPLPGTQISINLTRYRSQGRQCEKTSWSPAMCWDSVFPRFDKVRIDPGMFGALCPPEKCYQLRAGVDYGAGRRLGRGRGISVRTCQ